MAAGAADGLVATMIVVALGQEQRRDGKGGGGTVTICQVRLPPSTSVALGATMTAGKGGR